jgi:hypothetical protein
MAGAVVGAIPCGQRIIGVSVAGVMYRHVPIRLDKNEIWTQCAAPASRNARTKYVLGNDQIRENAVPSQSSLNCESSASVDRLTHLSGVPDGEGSTPVRAWARQSPPSH